MFDSILDLFDRERRSDRRGTDRDRGLGGMLGRLIGADDDDHRRPAESRAERERSPRRDHRDDDDDVEGGGRGPRRSRRDQFGDD